MVLYKGYLSEADRLAVVGYLREGNFLTNATSADTYQWLFDATNSGATNSTLTLTNLQTNDAGTYTVIVTDPAGSVTSLQRSADGRCSPRHYVAASKPDRQCGRQRDL